MSKPGVIVGSNASSGGGAPSGAAGGSLTGTYPNPTIATIPSGATATTQAATDGSTKVATTAYVDTADALKANLASPTLTGTPAAPSAAQGTNTTQIATTAMVHSEAVLLAPLASPTFTGTPASTTAAVDTNTTQVATTAYVVGQGYAKLASPTFSGTPSLPTGTTGTTQSASDNSTKISTTAYVDTGLALKANLASPTFTGTPTLPTGTIATTQAVNDNSTKIATTASVLAQDNAAGTSGQFGPNTFWNMPYYVAGSQIAVPNAGDGRWIRVMMGKTGTLHDVSFMVNTTGGNYNILILDDGQANATHTVRTNLAAKGSTATPAASAYITLDPSLAVNAGDTLVFMLTFDGTTAKAAASTGSLGGIAMPASFFPGSGAATTSTKICGTCLAASVPATVSSTVTDANMVVAANSFFCIWRIT